MIVSVIMLTFNHEDYIGRAIKGVLNQKTNFDIELIIADDASSDGTDGVASFYKEMESKIAIRYFKHERNIGMHKNFQFAFQKKKGEFVALCEGDDYWIDPLKLQKQVNFLQTNSDVSFCYTRFKTLNQESGVFKSDLNFKYFESNPDFVDFTFETFQKGWHIGNQTLVFKADRFNEASFKIFPNFKDVHLISQLLKNGKGACLNFVGAVYRIHNNGIHSGISKYDGYKIGYNTHKEIYYDNTTNKFLKRKLIHSTKNFINASIVERDYFTALHLSWGLFFLNWSLLDFLKHINRIIKAL